MTLLTSSVATPVGPFSFTARDGKVIEATFGSSQKLRARGRIVRSIPVISPALRAYFGGELEALEMIPVELSATEFRTRVLRAMRKIPVGTTVSYKELARKSGSEDASRAVGSTCASNRIPLIIPCHRVIPSDGSIGAYGYGTKKKQWLLEFEGAISRS
jgi:methylated-DNA-[protein]-cysteine S-methyltransferase